MDERAALAALRDEMAAYLACHEQRWGARADQLSVQVDYDDLCDWRDALAAAQAREAALVRALRRYADPANWYDPNKLFDSDLVAGSWVWDGDDDAGWAVARDALEAAHTREAALVRALYHEVRHPINVPEAEWEDDHIRLYLLDRYGLRAASPAPDGVAGEEGQDDD